MSELAGQLIERPWLAAAQGGTLKTWLHWTLLEPRLDPIVGAPATSLAFAAAVVALWLAVAAVLRHYRMRLIA